MLSRRRYLAGALATAGLLAAAPLRALVPPALLVENVTRLYPVEVARVGTPGSTTEVAEMVRAWPARVAVGGGRYSMGGQVAIAGGLHLDMRGMNQLVWLRAADRRVRVQAGMRWRDLQDHLDPLDLSVKTMQSYANFSVGGSVSVNVHGRYVGHGPIVNTVRALQLVLADGGIVEATPTHNAELFRAAIGGYGAVGVITEVELDLADNVCIERVVRASKLEDYVEHFEQQVLGDPASVLHNADLLPPEFDAPVGVTWRRCDRPLTELARLVPRGKTYELERDVIWGVTELPGGAKFRRSVLQPMLQKGQVVKRLNHEASLDVAELEPRSRTESTYVLQEYFIPKRHFLAFARAMAATLRQRHVNALNVSIRHSPADSLSLLPWAKEEVFSFVLYYKQKTDAAEQARVGEWTRELIALALRHEGRYYLPYQLHATREQFAQAYPESAALRALKQRVDPAGKFSNELWARYL
ncbi:FAD-binding oxidoreductase [Piscinibacter terrae]|nr:FAD-binding oxidoreductase [Albitalea terrae]